MHNNIHTVAPTPLYNHTKLEHSTTPYSELALDRWMSQNSPFYSQNTQVYNLVNMLIKHHFVKLNIIV